MLCFTIIITAKRERRRIYRHLQKTRENEKNKKKNKKYGEKFSEILKITIRSGKFCTLYKTLHPY